MEEDSVFKDPDFVEKQMDLPDVVDYSFVGDSSPEYHAKLEKTVESIVGRDNIRRRTFKESSGGNYTAYRYQIFHYEFAEVESIYREVGKIPGTKFVV